MADETEELEEQEAPKKSGMSMKAIIGIIAGVIVLQVAVVVFVLPSFMEPDQLTEQTEGEEEEENAEEEESEEPGYIHQLDKEYTINAYRSKGFALFEVAVELESMDDAAALGEMNIMPLVNSRITKIVGSKTADELQDPMMRDSIAAELIEDLNQYTGEIKIRNLFFPKFVVQQ